MSRVVSAIARRLHLEILEKREVLATGYGIDFTLFTDDTLSTQGLTGSYVDQNLRGIDELDWRVSQTISGTKVGPVFYPWSSFGDRADVGITGGSDGDWDNFSVQWDGVIQIHEDDVTLAIRSDDGSRLWVDRNQDQEFDNSELVETNWGIGGGATVGPSTPPIPVGVYDIRIQYEEATQSNSIALIANPIQPIGEFAIYTDATSSVPGLTGSYVNQDLRFVDEPDWRASQTISGTRIDASLDFTSTSWGTRTEVGLTGGSDVDWDNFSVQWDGYVDILEGGTTLATRSDDGSRMWIDVNQDNVFESSELVNNRWGNGQAASVGDSSVALEPGLYAIRIQYEEGFGGNSMELIPGVSRTVRVAYLIPSNQTPEPNGVANLQDLMPRMQAWYREQMDRNGFGLKTFQFETEADGVTPKIHLVGLGIEHDAIALDLFNNSNTAAATAGVRNWVRGEIWLILPEAHVLNPDGSVSGAGGAVGSGFGSGDDAGVAVGGSSFIFRSGAETLWDDTPYAGQVFPDFGSYPLVQNVSFPSFEGSTVSSIASSAQGALAHELGHAFGLWHDGRNDRNFHGNLEGNGLRGLRGYAHPELFPDDDMRLAYATALTLNQSRYFNRDEVYGDNSAPNLTINTTGTVNTVNGLVEIGFSADDPSGLALALLRHNGRGETVGEMSLSGPSVTQTFTTSFYDNPGGNDDYTITVYDTQGNRRDSSVSLTVTAPTNRPPRPSVFVFHSTAVVGNTVTLDASSSSDPDDASNTLVVEWDVDGDGTFDTAPTTTKELTTLFSEGTHMVTARITDPAGNQVVSAPLAIRIHPLGDFDLDNSLGVGDLAMLQNAVAKNIPDPQFDLTGDTSVTQEDIDFWLGMQADNYLSDFTENGRVDGADFLVWQRGFSGIGVARSDGNADGDQDIDSDDLAVWQAQYGQLSPIVTAATLAAISSNDVEAELAKPILDANLIDAAMAWDMARDKPEQEIVLPLEPSFAEQPVTATNKIRQLVAVSSESADTLLSNDSSEQQKLEVVWLSDELLESVFG